MQLTLGLNSFWTGHFAEATTSFDQMQHDGLTSRLRAGSRYTPSQTVRALNDGFLEYLDRCREALSETVLRARGEPDIHFVALALTHHALGHLLAGEEFVARSSAEEAIALSKEHGFEERAAIGKCIRGIALTDQGLLEDGVREIGEGLSTLRGLLSGCFDSWFYSALALAQGKAGRPQEGFASVDRVLEIVKRRGGEAFYLAEAHRIKGELLLMQNVGNTTEAADLFRLAINISRGQHSRLLELRATISLARLLERSGARDSARAMLINVYSWFTEGFDTADLKHAKALLDELKSHEETGNHPLRKTRNRYPRSDG